MRKHSPEYLKRITSREWYEFCRKVIRWAGNKCERCGATGGLEVHHKHYDTLGHENPNDVLVVCGECHKLEDAKREEETAARSEEALHDAQLDGWARKVIGEDWDLRPDVDEIEARYERWREKKDREY